ncbi:uncharacterized protein [Haliotis asinina]|uniref:uncharacterized protein n=1 Tax=Haliotis asinina TaxID=109174 RepID=UPI0035327742
MMSAKYCAVFWLCTLATWNLSSGLAANGVNVEAYTTYWSHRYTTSCGFWNWGRCTRYRRMSTIKYRCKTGYRSTDNTGCPHPICDSEINPIACNIDYRTSHIIYSNGRTQYKSGGSCTSPGICANCNEGFYPSRERCRMCSAISNCDLETCTSSSNQVCSRCEGVVMEQAGYRAYVASSDRTSCKQACSWRSDSTRCYPGTCRNEYASNCVCFSGFTGKHCQTITIKPTINFNLLSMTASNGDTTEAPPDINSGPSQSTSWSNINSPSRMYYKFKAEYKMVPPSTHAFIEDFRVGIVTGSATFRLKRGAGVVATKVYNCGGASRSSPDTDLYTCEGNSSGLPLPFQHRDIIELSFSSSNGGYVKVRNKESNTLTTQYYNGATRTHTFTVSMDLVDPYHCTGTAACVGSMLTVPDVIKTSTVNLRWSGWSDDDAGLDHFVRDVYELHAVGDELRDKYRVNSTTLTSSATSNSYILPDVGVYSVVLSAYDKAGNRRSARRILICDGTSAVTTRANTSLRVTTASSATSEWQTTSSVVTVDWTNRYMNTVHHKNKWLLGVASLGDIGSDYDDNEDGRGVDAINNVQGIARFLSSYKVGHHGGSSITSPPSHNLFISQGLHQSQTITPSLVDGDTVRFWVRAYDIRSEFLEEHVTVHIDASPPVIEDLWLTRGDRLNISVHSAEEFSEMTIEWIAYDEHSGLETVSWRIVDKYQGLDIVHGVQHITAQGETSSIADCKSANTDAPRGANCYCTPAKGCYHRHFQVKPIVVDSSRQHGGIFSNKNKGSHESDYYLEVTVTNHAKLKSKMEFKVTVDASPPHPGVVHDGQLGNPEVDYQQHLQLFSHWDGFFDRESGVKFYQYNFGPHCLSANEFGVNRSSFEVMETYSTSASWTAPSVGKYHVTVVAFNRALEASEAVCSDGVTIDTTPPSVSEVAVRDSRVIEGLVKSSENVVWYIDVHRRRTLVVSPDETCSSQATSVDDKRLSLFPIHRYNNGSEIQLNNPECKSLLALPVSFIKSLYVYREHHLFVNWTGSDSQSGIYDYELGLMSDPSGEAAPDILPYTSTHHHPQYQGYHPHLSEGQQFYIAIKAINKAGISTVRVVGPVTVYTRYPAFTGSMTVTLKHDYLIARWQETAFTETGHLKYEAAVGTKVGKSTMIPFTTLQSGDGCALTSPPTCTAFALTDLHWDLHHSHTYFVSVRVTNIVGLSTVAVSEPYVHDVMPPLRGVVEDVIPPGEETLFTISDTDDADYQISTRTLAARWYGFDNGITGTTYGVGIGSQPFTTDIREHVDVGNATLHSFKGLSLQWEKKYFVTVVASTDGGGDVMMSSDGVTVIRPNVDITDVIIRDGLGCTDSVNGASRSAVNQTRCSGDNTYQVSTSSYAAHWKTNNWLLSYPDVLWSLQKKVNGSVDLWDTERTFEPLGTSDMVVASGLTLEPGTTYRAAVKFCVVNVCSKPIHSDGVTVIPHPPTAGIISLTYHESDSGQAQIQVKMSRFHDPDIKQLQEAYDVIDRYEWGLTDDTHDDKMLIDWQTVDADAIESVADDKIRFTVNLPKRLHFTKCRRLSVRGYNHVGLHTTVSADVRECAAYNPLNIVPAVVLDVIGENKENVDQGITLDQNIHWHDVDYTPYKNILSAVWPTLHHRNYTWAVVAGDRVDPSSHYKRESLMTVPDPCSMPDVIRCGHTAKEFINVEFTELSYLQHGRRFYVCIHADDKNTRFEKWRSYLTEVNACSDGITVDLTPPTSGTVNVENLVDGTFQVSGTEVVISWTGFTDVEEEGFSAHAAGITYYEVALGTSPGGQDVVIYTHVGYANTYILHSLNLHTGSTYYVSVRATDFVKKTTVAVSAGFLVDATPPVLTGQHIEVEDRYITSRLIHVCWKNVFSDEESGTKSYSVAMGTRHAYADVVEYVMTVEECLDIDTFNKTEDGHSYYITVKAINGAGLYTLSTSRPLVVDTTPPSSGHVYDGVQSDVTHDDKDKDYITSVSEMAAYWEGFGDPHSSVAMYKVKVGTCKGCDDKMNEAKTGLHQYISLQHILLSPGVKYFTTVTACNTAGLCSSSSTSDGVILDSSPPVPGTVQDGTGDVDIQFQATRTFIGCKWRGFSDPESGLDHYEWRIGTNPGADDILKARTAAVGEVIFHTLKRDQQLPVGRTLYSTIRAFNKAGQYSEATSNGLLVDDSVPIVVTPPTVRSLMSLVPNTTISRTVLSLHWEFQDAESSIERQYLSISSHQLAEIDRSNLEVPGFLREYTFVNLDLHDGSKYKVKVTACNMAGLCVSANTNNILVDSSKPNTGTFAIETDHAAKLSRHQAGWMTWNRTNLNLAWLGFSDLHSGMDHYLVTVGSHEFGTDYNTGTPPEKVFHSDSGGKKGDEGVLQRFTVRTRTLPSTGSVFVAIWGVNGVGLQSDAYHTELVLEGDSTLWLVRRCHAYNCEGHCVCAVQGGTCSSSKACPQDKTDGAEKNITIKDVVDLMSLDDSNDVDVSLFNTVMAATWADSSKGSPVTRYEYSIGESDGPFPVGVFDATNGRDWFDAGLQTSAFVSLPVGTSLTSGITYSLFVRAWYNKTYTIFKSNGVLIQTTPPTVTGKTGRAVKELAHPSNTKAIDFQTQNETLFVQWSGKFLQGQRGILRYRVFISTVQGGHSIHASGNLNSTNYTVTGLSLRPNTIYYCSVMAYNEAGLVSWAYSDGVQVDVMPPVAGTVKDGVDIHDMDYQSSTSEVSASWYGFSDTDSTIVKYFWCVGTSKDTTNCSVMDWLDTGLHTSSRKSLLSPIVNGTRIWNKVYAVDAAGYTSDVVVSDGVVVDASPPERQDLAYLGDNLVKNPSFEVDDISGSTTPCNLVIPTSWESNTASCITVQAPNSPLAKDGHVFVSVSGSIQQTIYGLETGRQYKLTLHAGYPETVSNTHRSVDAIVTIGSEVFSFTLDPNLCRGTCSVGDHSVVLWNKHTYRFTAADTSVVLKIASSSRMMKFVLDHVIVQSVHYVAGPDSVDKEEHLVIHSVFLSHWSSLHASWHFEDQQSPITQYKWAIGTTPGGTYVQSYTDLGRDTQGTLSNVQLLHGASIYITVMATNAAGLSAVTHSDAITVDMTAPQFDLIGDGLDGRDKDHQTSGVVAVYWQVRDDESGVEHCDWAIGRTPGGSDMKQFERVIPGRSTAQHDVTSKLDSSSVTVFSTVRCFNKAGLASAMTSDGVEVVQTTNQTSVLGFSVLAESQSVYSERDVCHQSHERVRLRWDKTSRHFKTVILFEGDTLTQQNVFPVQLEYTFATLVGVTLKDGSTYHALSFPIDRMELHGKTTMLNITVHGIPPSVTASGSLSVVKAGDRLTLAWRNMFASPWDDLTYEVHAGTVFGGANIVDKLLTENDEITLTLNSQYRGFDEIYVTVAAIDTCGLSTWSTQTISLN